MIVKIIVGISNGWKTNETRFMKDFTGTESSMNEDRNSRACGEEDGSGLALKFLS